MEDCIFCKIISKKISTRLVYEDEYVIAFDDIHPVAPVHTLIVPKKHIRSIMDIKEEEDFEYIKAVHKAIQKVARIKEVDGTGFRIITNYGVDGGQTINHLHYHLIGGRKLGPKIVHD